MAGWTNIVEVAAGYNHTVGLKADGTVVGVGASWVDLVASVGLDRDSRRQGRGGQHPRHQVRRDRAATAGLNTTAAASMSQWTGIVDAAIGVSHAVGLHSDGTVVALGWNQYFDSNRVNVAGLNGITDVACGSSHTVCLRADGRVVAVGDNTNGACDVSGWLLQLRPISGASLSGDRGELHLHRRCHRARSHGHSRWDDPESGRRLRGFRF